MSKKRYPPPANPLDVKIDIEDFKVKLVALIRKFPCKRTSELPGKWLEEFGEELDYQAVGFLSLLPCLRECSDVIELYQDESRDRDIHHRVRLKPTAKIISETLSLPPPLERTLSAEELRQGRIDIDGAYSADDQLSAVVDAACQSCREIPSRPIALQCGHLVCKVCLLPRAPCPKKACGRRVEGYREIPEDCELNELLWLLPVKCCNSGCSWTGTRNASIGHAGTCPFSASHAKRAFGNTIDWQTKDLSEPITLAQYNEMIAALFQ